MEIIDEQPIPFYEVTCPECRSIIRYRACEVSLCHITCPVCGVSIWANTIRPIMPDPPKRTDIRLIDANNLKNNIKALLNDPDTVQMISSNDVLDVINEEPTVVLVPDEVIDVAEVCDIAQRESHCCDPADTEVVWIEERNGTVWPSSIKYLKDSAIWQLKIGDNWYERYEPDEYNRTWRCWPVRPTKQKREATPWQD